MKKEVSIFWFRRDLRLEDNTALYHALKNNKQILPIFIFDIHILKRLENKKDKRVNFIYNTLKKIKNQLETIDSSLLVFYDSPINVFSLLIQKYQVINVYVNRDYENYAKKRDLEIENLLTKKQIKFYSFKDQVIFDKSEILKDNGTAYTIYTPYMNKWRGKLTNFYITPYRNKKYFSSFLKTAPFSFPKIEELGFESTEEDSNIPEINENLIRNYNKNRNYPSIDGTSRMSVHLRFGTISIRSVAAKAKELSDVWLNELIWREFYMMVLDNFPFVEERSFKKQYDRILWKNDEKDFQAWCEGKTGYPLVDAGMIELKETGFIHNRVRMIVAGFLVKHLLIDWRWGESYFAEKLIDYELASNNGGWQWSVGSGCSAAPYFRIFNPEEQIKKFDSKHKYIKKWIPNYDPDKYIKPIVEHKFARQRALKTYKAALSANTPKLF